MKPCPRCADRGLIRVEYHSGEPFDIAVCDCIWARPYRLGGEVLVRSVLHLGDVHRVANREDFDGEVPAPPPADFVLAGKVKRAKL